MMKEKQTINDVLNQLGFNTKEKEAFVECVKAVKKEQKEEDFDAEQEIASIIEEVVKDEDK